MGFPIHELIQQRFETGSWKMETSASAGWLVRCKSRCRACKSYGLWCSQLLTLPCGHQLCETCNGKSMKPYDTCQLTMVERTICPSCSTQLWEVLPHVPKQPNLEWPDIVSSDVQPIPNTAHADELVQSIMRASVEGFRRINVQDMVAFAVNRDARGFKAFNHAHLCLARGVAGRLQNAEQHVDAFWFAVYQVRAHSPHLPSRLVTQS